MQNVFIIKNKLDAQYRGTTQDNIQLAERSLENNTSEEYSCRELDQNTLKDYCPKYGKEGYIMLVSYKKSGKIKIEKTDGQLGVATDIESVYIGIATVNEPYNKIKFTMKKRIINKSVIIDLLDGIDLNLVKDFDDHSYLMIRNMNVLYSSIRDILTKPIQGGLKNNYSTVKEKYKLAECAQHNDMCRRMYGLLPEEKHRNEFQRDRERIVNSKAFRRLVDKAQIFSADKGDHYRTRMTHTLEVNQIAKAISTCLQLNLDLTEAIALGHDLGHTPFGHQGERTIRDILFNQELEGLFNIQIDNFDYKSELGGFKHNYQGIKVLTELEEKYVEYPGLDISFQVLEGILKHTKLKDAQIKEFINEKFVDELHIDKPFCTNLEGQVVAIADEIAQRGHDIDDAITSGLINIDEILESLSAYKFQDLYEKIKEEKINIDSYKRHYVDERELTIGRIISAIVNYFIDDVVEKSKSLIEEYVGDKTCGIFDEKLINFSERGELCCHFLEKIINKKVIANAEVARFDYNANVVIRKLFELYYKNPKLLHSGKIRKIYIDTLLCENEGVADSAVDFQNGNLDIVGEEIRKITSVPIKDLSNEDEMIIFCKRKILIRNIADYIAGMTDSYAMQEYRKICG